MNRNSNKIHNKILQFQISTVKSGQFWVWSCSLRETPHFIHSSISELRKKWFKCAATSLFRWNTVTFHLWEFMFSHLSVVGLHMWNVGLSFREPLETLSTRPAGGLHTRSAVLFGLFSGIFQVFNWAATLLLLDGMSILVPVSVVWLFTSLLCLCCHVTYMNVLQNRNGGFGCE